MKSKRPTRKNRGALVPNFSYTVNPCPTTVFPPDKPTPQTLVHRFHPDWPDVCMDRRSHATMPLISAQPPVGRPTGLGNGRLLARWFGSLVILLSTIGWTIATASDEFEETGATELRVVPSAIVVTPNYPARFAVSLLKSDGTSVDVTTDPELQIRPSPEGTLSLEALSFEAGQIRTNTEGTTELEFLLKGSTLRVPVISAADTPISFQREIMATLTRSGCNLGVCHGNLHGKGGFRLSLRGDDPAFDHYRISEEFGQRRVDVWQAAESLILQKGTAKISHQGGKRFHPNDTEYAWIKQWIEQGAQATASPELESLWVEPPEQHIVPSRKDARLVVLARFSDRSVRDVTRWARMELSLPSGVSIDGDGVIQAQQAMDVSVGVTYLSGRAAARFVFLGDSNRSTESDAPSLNLIDRWVEKQCRELQIAISPRADDWTLIRRLYLVTVGRLPTPSETLAFVEDSHPERMQRWVDSLLADPDFDYAWALRWSDLLRNEDKVMSSHGAGLFHTWLRTQIASDRSMQSWIGELVSSVGSTYENPPASFHRTHRDPFVAAESSAQVFLGVRLQCAKCHNHPFDSWRQDDYYGLAAYFTTLDRKQIDNKPKDALDKHVITGDEVISLSDRKAEIQHPGRSQKVPPRPLPSKRDRTTSPRSVESADPSQKTPLQEFALWLTEDNSQFDANIANRIWYQYFGRGIVDPPDDFRDSNPPSNPELLQFLQEELRASGYSLKSLTRMILTSETFARAAATDSPSDNELASAPYFAGFPARRLGAEVLMDAIADVTQVQEKIRGGDEDASPPLTRAMHMPGVPRKPGFLTAFGKPNRLLVCECERTNQVSLGQSLVLVNGTEVRGKLTERNNCIDRLTASMEDPKLILDQLFLRALCRLPTEKEIVACLQTIDRSPDRRVALEDILWALLNSKEFVMLR